MLCDFGVERPLFDAVGMLAELGVVGNGVGLMTVVEVVELHLTAAGSDALERAEAVIVRLVRQTHEILGPDGYDQLRILLDDVVAGLAGWADDDIDPHDELVDPRPSR